MPRKRKKKLRPRLPSRVKKTRTKRSARARTQHPELWGLGAVALGLFLGAVLYFGWNGGYVGGWLRGGVGPPGGGGGGREVRRAGRARGARSARRDAQRAGRRPAVPRRDGGARLRPDDLARQG